MGKKYFVSICDNAAQTSVAEAARTITRGVQKKRRHILIGRDAKLGDNIVRLFPGSYEKRLKPEQSRCGPAWLTRQRR